MAICVLCEENELAPRSQLKTCSGCRSSFGRWAKRSNAEIMNRRRKLHIYDMRMEVVAREPGNLRAVPIVKPFVSATQLRKQAKEIKKNGVK
jgi:hypothetical protein